MPLDIQATFTFQFDEPGDALLQFEVADVPGQRILSQSVELTDEAASTRVPAHDGIGTRIWVSSNGRFETTYRAKVETQRAAVELATMPQLAARSITGEAAQYLFDSRYCSVGPFQNFVEAEFSGTSGGARIAAIEGWLTKNMQYEPGASGEQTTAADSFVARQGVCRDYAHVLIALARASLIPARYVACYGPDVSPQDFHAVAEVFLADPAEPTRGEWHLVDATGMAKPSETAIIGVGRDAADVSFLTTFGPARFLSSKVEVKRV